MLGISLLAFISGITNSFFAAYASQNFGFDIRKSLFSKVQAFSFANFNNYPASSLITRMTNDVNQLQMTLFMSLRIALRAPLLVIGGITLAIMVNVKLALAFLLVIPFLIFFLIWIMKRSSKLFSMVQQRLDRVNGVMRENLAGIRLIRAFSRGTSGADGPDSLRTQVNRDSYSCPVVLYESRCTGCPLVWENGYSHGEGHCG
jgi:ATP-binding cassette subfamily B protein